ncbi:MAG: amino acid adenylation domain-containing protein, partial [Cyanobacteria bacterium P01_F01_bin.150]
MMPIETFLSDLKARDIEIWIERQSHNDPNNEQSNGHVETTSAVRLRCSAPKGILTPELTQQLSTRKPEIIAYLQHHHGSNQSPIAKNAHVTNQGSTEQEDSLTIHPTPRTDSISLSFAQQRLWFLEKMGLTANAYNMPLLLHLKGQLDRPALQTSLNQLVARHEPLRTRFSEHDGTPVQLIDAPFSVEMPLTNLSHVPSKQQTIDLHAQLQQASEYRFNLEKDHPIRTQLFALSDTEHVLLILLHHIASDGWSSAILSQDLSALYESALLNQPSRLSPLPIQYADFAVWQRQWLQGETLEQQLGYWKSKLQTLIPLQLPTDYPRPAVETFNGAGTTLELSPTLTAQLKQLAQRSGVTLFMLLLAGFKVLLCRYTGQEGIVVGSPIANRNRPEIEGLIGFFVNSLVMHTDLSGNPSFREVLRRVRQTALEAYDHQDVPFEKLVEELQPERSLSYHPLFQVMLSYQQQKVMVPTFNLPNLEVSWYPGDEAEVTTRFDIELQLWPDGDNLKGSCIYNRDLFEASTIERMLEHYETVLAAIATAPDTPIHDLQLLSPSERQQLLVEWNQTTTNYPSDQCIHQLFEAQAEKSPDAIAVVFDHQSLTYCELNSKANQLAYRLQHQHHIGPGTLVGICAERSLNLIVGLLSILKTGGAYLPLDPNYPQHRLSQVINESKVTLILTDHSAASRLPETNVPLVWLDQNERDAGVDTTANPSINGLRASSLAYVLYTSGSTGRPKGVAIEHRSAVALISWARDVFNDEQLSGVLASTSICFDLSVFEIFVPLSWGGKVILAENALHLPSLPASQQVRLVNTVPSAARSLITSMGIPAGVKTINLAGESLDNTLVQQLYEHGSIQRVYNLYGPSEDTTYSTFALMSRGSDHQPSIGRPIANGQAYILDRYKHPVPIGVIGELYLGGAGLARSYRNQPELTSEKFIAHPFSDEPGARLYKTGDLVRYRPDGNIEFLGRIDHQVKIRGFRIETGEIEATLAQHPVVKEAVVVVYEQDGDKRLVAYLVAQSSPSTASISSEDLISEVRSFVKERLPDYMVPSAFMVLEQLPLTPNGKVDRRALPAPDLTTITADYVAPRTPTEQAIAD